MGIPEFVKNDLKDYHGRPVKIMEVCGTHTASIFRHGIRSLLSPAIKLISGPGCPVCVTSSLYIDKLIDYALKERHCVLTFGDMMKVKGSQLSLSDAKALGGSVSMLYSPLSALSLAEKNPEIQYIFAAVGFETTVPVYGLLMDELIQRGINNLKLLTSIKTIIPAMSYLCNNEKGIDAFLCPGHVSVITGSNVYQELAVRYQKPFVITGFEGEHILASLYEIMKQLESGSHEVKNLYPSVVTEKGNEKAQEIINKYFKSTDDIWREIGVIEASALQLRDEYEKYDAGSRLDVYEVKNPRDCRCRDVILGRIHPVDCPLFAKVCTPMNAIGPCMVSAEGACGIWYKNRE